MCQDREGQTSACVQKLQMQDYSFTDVRLDPIIPSASLPFSMISTSAWFQSRIRRVKTWGPCNYLGQCGFPSFASNNNMVWSPPKTGKSLPSTLFTFPQPHRGVLFYMVVEGLWPSATWPDVPPWSHGCWLQGHHSWWLPRVDPTYQAVLSQVHRLGKHQMWCWWKHLA